MAAAAPSPASSTLVRQENNAVGDDLHRPLLVASTPHAFGPATAVAGRIGSDDHRPTSTGTGGTDAAGPRSGLLLLLLLLSLCRRSSSWAATRMRWWGWAVARGVCSQEGAILAGPVAFGLVLAFLRIDEEQDPTGRSAAMVAAMSWVFIWWVTEAAPLAATSLVPLFLFPLLRIETASAVSRAYTNDTIFLILGSFILAAAVRFHNLHKRLALHIVLLFGRDPRLLLFGFCAGAAFVSMWVDNAAAAAMLMPMASGVQQKVHVGFHPPLLMHQQQQQRQQEAAKVKDDQSSFEEIMIIDNSITSVHMIDNSSNDPSTIRHVNCITSISASTDGQLAGAPDGPSSPQGILLSSTSNLEKQTSMELEKHLSHVLIRMDPARALQIETDFCRGVSIAIAYSVTIGGMATLTGNAVNLVLTGIWETDFPSENPIFFLQWMLFAVPFCIVLVLAVWLLICAWFCPPSAVKPVSASLHSYQLEDELKQLGPISSDQILILILFLILIVLWMTKSITGSGAGWANWFDNYPANGTATILVAVLLFVIPNPADPKQKLMNWSQCKDIHWNVILLIGGGFALADGIKTSGLSEVISSKISFLESTPYWAITPTIVVVTAVATEFSSNAAIASVFVPLMAEVAVSIGRHPLFLMVPAALGSQFSFMLPIATGANAIAYSTESMRIRDMAAPGVFLKLFSILFISLLMPTLGAVIFNTN